MRPEQISDALGLLSDKMIQETNTIRERNRMPRRPWQAWTAAACLCAAVLGSAVLLHRAQTGLLPSSRPLFQDRTSAGRDLKGDWTPEVLAPDGLPLLEPNFETGGMGFEGLLYYRFSQMDNGNPWHQGMELDTLPVFRNNAYHPAGVPVGLAVEEMEERARTAAAALGLEDPYLQYRQAQIQNDVIPYDQIVCVTVITKGIQIDAEANGTLTVHFDGGLPLPEEYRFEYHDTTRQEAEAVLDCLIDRYAPLLNFRRPQKALSGDYNFYGEFGWDYRVYDAAEDDVDDLLNYGYRCADFAPDGNGNLMLIRLYDGLACAEKLGDYPLISLEEARQALLEGKYFTSVPYDLPGEAYVRGGELVYRNVAMEKAFLPYYRFYAELPEEEQENGLRTFGAYYVPAIEPRYFKEGWEARWYF